MLEMRAGITQPRADEDVSIALPVDQIKSRGCAWKLLKESCFA